MVEGILKHSKLEELLNAEDKSGNTVLHLASTNLHALVLCSLTWDKRVDLKRKNKARLLLILFMGFGHIRRRERYVRINMLGILTFMVLLYLELP